MPLATSSRMWTRWVRVSSRVYWASATCSNRSSRVGSSNSHSVAIRVMTVAAAPWAKGLRIAGRITYTSGFRDLLDLRWPRRLRSRSLHVEEGGREGVSFDPVHYLALLERKPGALD